MQRATVLEDYSDSVTFPASHPSVRTDMLSNVHDDITTSDRTTVAIRYSTWHSISSPKASRFTGRAGML
ncbi:hypothetical protein Y032_0096g2914 [Ancylostoma ceylanicum]|nr:hypothetical protein Y032_0096g2914 [Ancylostoma ceylanicum]